jgi:NitT/TauT family transport system ATP-binding protein
MALDATSSAASAPSSPGPASALSVRGIAKTYGHGNKAQLACSDITFDVRAGEFLSIVGPSGCGKTTLIKIIAGLLNPSAGYIELFGSRVETVPLALSVVFQDYSRSLFPWLRVAANVSFPLDHLPMPKAERVDRVASALAAVGLAGAETKYPWNCRAACSNASPSRAPSRTGRSSC